MAFMKGIIYKVRGIVYHLAIVMAAVFVNGFKGL